MAILRLLQTDNKVPQRIIAEQVNLSIAAVQRRIAALEQDGVIAANVAIVSPQTLRYGIMIVVEVHLEDDKAGTVDAAKALFQATAEVQQCYYVAGNGGFILIMVVPDMPTYAMLAHRLFAQNETVKTYRTLVVLDSVKVGLGIPLPDPGPAAGG